MHFNNQIFAFWRKGAKEILYHCADFLIRTYEKLLPNRLHPVSREQAPHPKANTMLKSAAILRTFPPFVLHIGEFYAPEVNPGAHLVISNPDFCAQGFQGRGLEDLSLHISNIMRFGEQRFGCFGNLACQILPFPSFEKLSSTINNCYAIKSC